MDTEKYITDLARQAVKEYIVNGNEVEVNYDELPEILKKPAGVFVTLKKNGNLRGCMGTFQAVQDNAAQEIINNAMTAAESDPRFPEVHKSELDELTISVDILTEAERVNDKSELDPKKYGVLVKGGHQTGLLLPDLEGIDTVDKQLSIAKKKAGLKADSQIDIFRFKVKRFKEND